MTNEEKRSRGGRRTQTGNETREVTKTIAGDPGHPVNESQNENEETATEIEIEIDTRGRSTVKGENAVEAEMEIEIETKTTVRETRDLRAMTESDHDHAHQYAMAAMLRSVLDHLQKPLVQTMTGLEVETRITSNPTQKTARSPSRPSHQAKSTALRWTWMKKTKMLC